MIFKIDPSNGNPVYEQIALQLKFAVASGGLKTGELIPSVRQMARDLAVNPNTVARAYRDLQDDGIVDPVRGTGLQIATGALRKCTSARREFLRERLRGTIAMARQSGIEDREIDVLFQSELGKGSGRRQEKRLIENQEANREDKS